MSGTPNFVEIEPHVSGTTWDGEAISYKNVDEDGVETEADWTGASARMVFRNQSDEIVFDWRLNDAQYPGLELDDPQAGPLRLVGPADGIVIAEPGQLRGHLRVIFAGGETVIDLRYEWQILASLVPVS